MDKTNVRRRRFLAGLGAAVAGSAVALAGKSESPGEVVTATEAVPASTQNYQVTEHVQKYYRTAGL